MRAFAPNGRPIVGIAETMPVTYSLVQDTFERNSAGRVVFDYAGEESESDCDGAEPVESPRGLTFIDDTGRRWFEDEIELR